VKKEDGFTLIELAMVVAIIGALALTAIPMFKTILTRSYGTEASLMLKQLLDGQIAYYLENEKFFSEDGQPVTVLHSDPSTKEEVKRIKNALNVTIPQGHTLDYRIQALPSSADDSCTVVISARVPIFKNGSSMIIGSVNKKGKVQIL
jgi:prepilin-type N-terminal cleavage/methylation domain-containing protein